MLNPCENLEGIVLDGGWIVKEKIEKGKDFSKGYFSVGYKVENKNGIIAFLKALNYELAFKSPDPVFELQKLTSAFVYERNVLELCKDKKLSKIIIAISNGSIKNPQWDYSIDYLIFEFANCELKQFLSISENFDLLWILKSIHEITVGLNQLHTNAIFHQDLKPSNVLIFKNNESKIGDLGRSTCDKFSCPHDFPNKVIGDNTYAPFEQLYGYFDSNERKRKIAYDMYTLGSMIMFYFSNTCMTASVGALLDKTHHWASWLKTGSYIDVLPYLNHAYNIVIEQFNEDMKKHSDLLREDIVNIVRQLCNPDIDKRGNYRGMTNGNNQYSVYYYISKFDLLCKRARIYKWR